jgi:hypothetical protein
MMPTVHNTLRTLGITGHRTYTGHVPDMSGRLPHPDTPDGNGHTLKGVSFPSGCPEPQKGYSIDGGVLDAEQVHAVLQAKRGQTLGAVLAKHGGARRGEIDQASDRSLKHGENTAYLAARLRRDHPDAAVRR